MACDFKCGFDRDDARWHRLNLPAELFAADYSDFEQEINQLRTHQGQSDVYVINDKGTILARPSAAAPARWSPRCSATTPSSLPTSAAARPTER